VNSGLKLLVVDDNVELCENIKDIGELHGHQVLVAHNGFQAVETIMKEWPQAVLLDIVMSELDGVATFKLIKSVAPELPVILMTAYSVEELVSEGLREGAFGILRKPLDFEALFSRIRDAARSRLLLVVDDDRDLCADLADLLSDRGFKVYQAYDADSAMLEVAQANFDAVILDMRLPTMSGLEAYLSMREIRPDLKVILISGYPREMSDLVQKAIEREAYAFIEKPLDMEQLFALVDEVSRREPAESAQ